MFKIGEYVEVVKFPFKKGIVNHIVEKRDTLYYGVTLINTSLSLFENRISYFYPSQIKKIQPYTKKDLL